MEPAKTVIDQCGGLAETAKACGRAVSSVRKWMVSRERRGTGGLVPAECQVLLLEASLKNGWALDGNSFLPPHLKSIICAEAGAPVKEAS